MTRTSVDSTVAGLPVHVWAGSKDGPTVLGLPGLGSSGRHWKPLAESLPDAHFVAPDLRGRGAAWQLTGPSGLRAHARDVAAIAAEMNLHDIVLVGHSMGAYLAPIAAQELGARVSRLVLIDGGVRPKFPFFMTAGVVRLTFKRQLKKMDREWVDATAFYDANEGGVLASRPDLVEQVRGMLTNDLVKTPNGVRAALDTARCVDDAVDSFMGPDVEPALAALQVPATLIAATSGRTDKAKPFLSDAVLAAATAKYPTITVQRVRGNHMTVLFSDEVRAAVHGE